MILLSTLRVIRHLIRGNNNSCIFNLNMIYNTLWTGAGSGLFISMLEKLNLFSFVQFNNTSAIHVESDGSLLEEKLPFEMLRPPNWIEALTLSLLLKLPPRKVGPWFVLWIVFHLMLLIISINLSYGLACGTVFMPGLVLLTATWKG